MRRDILKWKAIMLILCLLLCVGCKKFLEEKTDKATVVPSSLADLDALLWSSNQINIDFPGLVELGTDDFYIKENMFGSLNAFNQQVYKWDKEIDFDVPNTNMYWTNVYHIVLTANTVLDKLKVFGDSDKVLAEKLEGEALFIRSLVFYYMLQIYAPAYISDGLNNEVGIPIKLSSDINESANIMTVKEAYEKILEDLTEARSKLDGKLEFKTRASRPAVNALLARISLLMGNYEAALVYAEETLEDYNKLIDYNELDATEPVPFTPLNDDVIFFAYTSTAEMISSYYANVDSFLYKQYDDMDIRKEIFFEVSDDHSIIFKGWYSAINSCAFMGLTTPEMYLILAECYARKNMNEESRGILKILLENRYLERDVEVVDGVSEEDLLEYVLQERRKELLFRGVRWSDLRRLNQEEAFRRTLSRSTMEDGIKKVYKLKANDPRYVYPLPQTVVDLQK